MTSTRQDIKLNHKIYKHKDISISVVFIDGYLDILTIMPLKKLFNHIKSKGLYKLIVHFKQVHHITSSGWGFFIGELEDFYENGGDMRFVEMQPNVLEIFQLLEPVLCLPRLFLWNVLFFLAVMCFLLRLLQFPLSMDASCSNIGKRPQPQTYGKRSHRVLTLH